MCMDLIIAGPIMHVAAACWCYTEQLLVPPIYFCGGLEPVAQFTAPSGAALLANLLGPLRDLIFETEPRIHLRRCNDFTGGFCPAHEAGVRTFGSESYFGRSMHSLLFGLSAPVSGPMRGV